MRPELIQRLGGQDPLSCSLRRYGPREVSSRLTSILAARALVQSPLFRHPLRGSPRGLPIHSYPLLFEHVLVVDLIRFYVSVGVALWKFDITAFLTSPSPSNFPRFCHVGNMVTGFRYAVRSRVACRSP